MRILIIDDEPLVAKTLKRLLRSYEVDVIHSSQEAITQICQSKPDLIFCDLMMPEMSGSELFDIISERCPPCAANFVFITGGAFSVEAEEFLSRPGKQVLYKPFDRKSLQGFVDVALARKNPTATLS